MYLRLRSNRENLFSVVNPRLFGERADDAQLSGYLMEIQPLGFQSLLHPALAFPVQFPEAAGNFFVQLGFRRVVKEEGIFICRMVLVYRVLSGLFQPPLIFFNGLELQPVIDVLGFVRLFLLPPLPPAQKALPPAFPGRLPGGRLLLGRFRLGRLRGRGGGSLGLLDGRRLAGGIFCGLPSLPGIPQGMGLLQDLL